MYIFNDYFYLLFVLYEFILKFKRVNDRVTTNNWLLFGYKAV